MKRIELILIVAAILLIAGSCQNNKKTGNSPAQTMTKEKPLAEPSKPVAHVPSPGEEAFRKNCLSCHQADGSGVPDMYPSLNQAEMVMGPPEGIIKAILFGIKGPTVINGKTYTQPMPPLPKLSDSTIAVLVSYVKKRWGGTETTVTENEVRKIRATGK